jgi:hypothetical protein
MKWDVRLQVGTKYDTAYLRLSRWVPFYAKSRNKLEFFADGVYLGPDADGTEPLFRSDSVRRALGDFGDLIDVKTWTVLRPATASEWDLFWRATRSGKAWWAKIGGVDVVVDYGLPTVPRESPRGPLESE